MYLYLRKKKDKRCVVLKFYYRIHSKTCQCASKLRTSAEHYLKRLADLFIIPSNTTCLGRITAELTNSELILIRSRVSVAHVFGLSSFVSGTVNSTLVC